MQARISAQLARKSAARREAQAARRTGKSTFSTVATRGETARQPR